MDSNHNLGPNLYQILIESIIFKYRFLNLNIKLTYFTFIIYYLFIYQVR
jgi:hypothetical protein